MSSISRRSLLTTAAGAIPGAAAFAQRASKPNIIFILADDLGYGDLGCYGQNRIRTPHLDRMAAEGMRFTDAYAGSTVCAPSRCCLMTGKHTGHAAVRGNKVPELGLRPGEATVASVLKQAGYRTALFGKWGIGGHDMNSHPNDRGFDEFFGYLNQHHAHQSFPDYLWENKSEHFLKDNWFFQRRNFSNDLFTDRARAYVNRQSAAQPFFMYLTYTIPHANNELGRMQKNGMESPTMNPYASENWPDAEKTFAAAITRMDEQVGALLGDLDRKGLGSNTLVMFSSDNGPHREGGHDPNFFASSGKLRGTKRDLYEGGIRVPAIARWTGKIAPGQISSVPWAFWDFLPTAAGLGGARVPAGVDGKSIVSLLGNPRASAPHEWLYWEFFEGGFQQAVRKGNWKLVRQAPKHQVELFDLSNDIGETRDVAARHPEVVRELQAIFRSARVDHDEFPTARKVDSVSF